jgi:hypothetical protein
MTPIALPNNADGDAMRRVIADGADLARLMKVDFQIDCPDLATAHAVAAKVPRSQFTVHVYAHKEHPGATYECSRNMRLERVLNFSGIGCGK